jgi:hypothetical protein
MKRKNIIHNEYKHLKSNQSIYQDSSMDVSINQTLNNSMADDPIGLDRHDVTSHN